MFLVYADVSNITREGNEYPWLIAVLQSITSYSFTYAIPYHGLTDFCSHRERSLMNTSEGDGSSQRSLADYGHRVLRKICSMCGTFFVWFVVNVLGLLPALRGLSWSQMTAIGNQRRRHAHRKHLFNADARKLWNSMFFIFYYFRLVVPGMCVQAHTSTVLANRACLSSHVCVHTRSNVSFCRSIASFIVYHS